MDSKSILFRFKTVQTNAIRILFESLKNILSDVNFKVDSRGIKLTTVDGTQSAIINLYLDASKFEEYTCVSEINIGLNLLSVFKVLKGIKNTDTVSFTVYQEDHCSIYITTENSDKKATITTKLKMLDMDEKIYSIPDIKFNSFITMPSSDFLPRDARGLFTSAMSPSCNVFLDSKKSYLKSIEQPLNTLTIMVNHGIHG